MRVVSAVVAGVVGCGNDGSSGGVIWCDAVTVVVVACGVAAVW